MAVILLKRIRFIFRKKHYLCSHEEDNDLDNSNNNGIIIPGAALSAIVIH